MSVEKIAYNIKFLRESHGYTQESLAKKLVTSRSNIAKWENNSSVPDIESLMKLSDIFGITLEQLVGRHSVQNELLKDFKRIYGSNKKPFDEEIMELTEYIMTFPAFKEEIYRLKNLPLKDQISIHELLSHLITKFDKR